MLRGHVFQEQLFGNQIFALFINTFLDGHNGIVNNYKNSMQLSYSNSNVTIDSGALCIQGRFLEEDSSTTIDVGTNTLFCKLVLEIDLDKQNTESDFNQGTYKIITGELDYPVLTQEDIVKNNSGIYQYELARFKTGISGISDFIDKRTFIDFKSIYTELEKQTTLATKQELATAIAKALLLTGGTMTGTLNSQSIIPTSNSQYSLGSILAKFSSIYADYLNFGDGHGFAIGWDETSHVPYLNIDGVNNFYLVSSNNRSTRLCWEETACVPYIDVDNSGNRFYLASSDNQSVKFNWVGDNLQVFVNNTLIGNLAFK